MHKQGNKYCWGKKVLFLRLDVLLKESSLSEPNDQSWQRQVFYQLQKRRRSYVRLYICNIGSTVTPSTVERFWAVFIFERVHYYGGPIVTKSDYDEYIEKILSVLRNCSNFDDLIKYVHWFLCPLWNDFEHFSYIWEHKTKWKHFQ